MSVETRHESIQQDRRFLLLDDSEAAKLPRELLKNMLDLAQEIICYLFHDKLETLSKMDKIKGFAAGLERVQALSSTYPVAHYYQILFPFHQWFHSSYRARQGKVLECVVYEFIHRYTPFKAVANSVKKEVHPRLHDIFGRSTQFKSDIDIFAETEKHDRAIAIQIRSRDDTGGTTAKGSLADLLREMLDAREDPSIPILYLIGVWDVRNEQQLSSTVEKIAQAIRRTDLKIEDIRRGVELRSNLWLRLAYGTDNIEQAIFEWAGEETPQSKPSLTDVTDKVSRWDDLWLAYAIASIELGIKVLHGRTNIQLLQTKYSSKLNQRLNWSDSNFQAEVEAAAKELVRLWEEESLPVRSPQHIYLYFCDLIYLKTIFERYCQSRRTQSRQAKERSVSYQVGETEDPMRVAEPTAPPYQFTLFPAEAPKAQTTPIEIDFRNIVPEIQDTNYLTHGVFYYPAKFIPHVPYYCVRQYCPQGGWVIDPFAGSGTVGLEAVLAGRNAILLDLNPLLNYVAAIKINFRDTSINEAELLSDLQAMFASERVFYPQWANLSYWYYPEILDTLARYWGWFHHQEVDSYTQIIGLALLKASRRFSLADHKAPKLFRSKAKQVEMEQIRQQNWKEQLDRMICESALDILKRARHLANCLSGNNCRAVIYAGIDSVEFELPDSVQTDVLITSPPYLQAQEYIRTFKLDLFWMGFGEEQIRSLSKLEIPYRKAPEVFTTPTYDRVYQMLSRPDLRTMMNSYFYFTTKALNNAASTLKPRGFMCIFVGNPKIDGIEVETWRVISEYFTERGFSLCGVYEDRIKNRQLFKGRRNKNPEGMPSEFLLVMQKSNYS